MGNKEIVQSEEKAVVPQSQSPAELMVMALSENMAVDKLEKILESQERYEKREAQKAYTNAMALFKKNPPKIIKDMNVSFKQTSYNHASLGNVTETINKSLAVHGFSSSWKTDQEKDITVTCTITHKLGHSESTTLSAPSDNSGAKNTIQAIGSTITYLQRYTLLALTGLATHDQDDDGGPYNAEYITDAQVAQLQKIIDGAGIDEAEYLAWARVESLDKIETKWFNQCLSTLQKKANS